jgi:heme exporter protein A
VIDNVPAQATIILQKLTKRFGSKMVLRGLDFRAHAGELIALVGANGAGKTTLIRVLATLLRPSQGYVHMAGYDLPEGAVYIRRSIGVVLHQPLLYDNLTASENLRYYGRIYGIHNLDGRIDHVLQIMGLVSRRDDLVRTLSRGMQQRLALSRALLHKPQILLLDEPHNGLDQDASILLDEIMNEVVEHGCTVLMTSHDLERVGKLASRVDVIERGMIVASAQHDQISDIIEFYSQSIRR